jgi:hypothetical protein
MGNSHPPENPFGSRSGLCNHAETRDTDVSNDFLGIVSVDCDFSGYVEYLVFAAKLIK